MTAILGCFKTTNEDKEDGECLSRRSHCFRKSASPIPWPILCVCSYKCDICRVMVVHLTESTTWSASMTLTNVLLITRHTDTVNYRSRQIRGLAQECPPHRLVRHPTPHPVDTTKALWMPGGIRVARVMVLWGLLRLFWLEQTHCVLTNVFSFEFVFCTSLCSANLVLGLRL